MMVAVTTTGHGVESKENARRIVACVNACAGIPTGDLESASVASYWQGVELNRQRLSEQRDELLAALEQALAWVEGEPTKIDRLAHAQNLIKRIKAKP
jgi:hypothetical protein